MSTPPRELRKLDRLTTGVSRLDNLLAGGIPRYSLVFVAGLPGTGKTILSQQALFANAQAGMTGLYLSTVSEPLLKVLRFLQGFQFFEPDLFGSRVIYGDLGGPLRKDGPAGLLQALDGLVREHRPSLVVIDSFKVLRESFSDPLAFREFTSDLAVRLSAWEVTALLVGEYGTGDIQEGAEFAIADGILFLYGTEEAERQKRFLRVMKMRGTSFFGGEHFFDINGDGVSLYPRMNPEIVGEYQAPGERIGSAITGLTEMTGGGLQGSTSTLISGGTGSGKSLMALSFLVEGARAGRPGLLVNFEESPWQIARNSQAFGWDVPDLIQRGLLDIIHVSPSELDIDRHAYLIKERADQTGANLVVIDSISAFEAAVPDPSKYQSYLWAINDYMKRKGANIIMTAETINPFAPLEISTKGVSFIADNVLFIRYVETGAALKRVVGVLKMRGSAHDTALRELIIRAPQIAVGLPLEQAGMLGATLRA